MKCIIEAIRVKALGIPLIPLHPSSTPEAPNSADDPTPTESFLTHKMKEKLEKVILDHPIPHQPTRTNVVTEDQVPRSRLFGAYCRRGCGVTLSTYKYPKLVGLIGKATHLAKKVEVLTRTVRLVHKNEEDLVEIEADQKH
eukprot:3720867-Amphidinium_carterae.1